MQQMSSSSVSARPCARGYARSAVFSKRLNNTRDLCAQGKPKKH